MPDAPQMDTNSAFGMYLHHLGNRWRRMLKDELESLGLTDATWRPLFHLGRLGDGLRQKELADALFIEGPSLVRLLDNLEAQALIERVDDPADRRCKRIRMTEGGRAIYRQAAAVNRHLADTLLGDIDAADIAVCFQVFDTLTERLDALQGAPDRP